MRFARVIVRIVLGLCGLHLAGTAHAEDEPVAGGQVAVTPREPLEVAREHMDRGQALYEAGRYIEAAEEFLRAYDAQPFSAFLYNAAVAYERLPDAVRAADYFERFLAREPNALGVGKLRARIARLRAADSPRASSAAPPRSKEPVAPGDKESLKSLVSIETTPADASVTIKDEQGQMVPRGADPGRAESIDPGRYFVEVAHPKYKAIATPITVAAGKVYMIIVEMSQGQFLGLLRAQSDVPGAGVYLDQRDKGPVGHTPLQVAVKTGDHHLWIERPGYRVVERDVAVGVGDDILVDVPLERVEHGRIRVVANQPDAVVFVDGKRVGRVPIETDVANGERTVRVEAPGMKDWTGSVAIARGRVTPVRVSLRPAVSRAGAWATAGVAAGVLTASIAVATAGKRTLDEVEDDRAAHTLESDDPRADRAKWMYVAADVGFCVTAVLGGLATYYFLRDPLPDSDARALEPRDWAFSPYLGGAGGGGHFQLSF